MKKHLPWLSLVSVGLLAAAGWRIELDWHGWDGLIWLKYGHWAVPAGMVLLTIWVAIFCGADRIWKRVLLPISFAAYVYGSWVAFANSVDFHWSGPPQNFLMLLAYGEEKLQRYHYLIYVVYAAIPLVGCALAGLWQWRLRPLLWLISAAIFLASCPVAIALLWATDHIGGPDEIHAIKSGFIIPMLMIGMALPFLPPREEKRAIL
ncbi:MAG: hypothetical protein ABFD92_13410 [Planctomycetaceae bacterium]|nr:hypothetical protein [Planctomycetaceae bacterium]